MNELPIKVRRIYLSAPGHDDDKAVFVERVGLHGVRIVFGESSLALRPGGLTLTDQGGSGEIVFSGGAFRFVVNNVEEGHIP